MYKFLFSGNNCNNIKFKEEIMRRGRNFFDDDMNMKVIKYSCIGIGILAVIVLGLLLYSKSLHDEVK